MCSFPLILNVLNYFSLSLSQAILLIYPSLPTSTQNPEGGILSVSRRQPSAHMAILDAEGRHKYQPFS